VLGGSAGTCARVATALRVKTSALREEEQKICQS
jgi:hypothetical protein